MSFHAYSSRKRPLAKALILLVSAVLLVGGAMSVSAQPDKERLVHSGPDKNAYADVTLTFHNDSLGFDAASSKDISNIVVSYCDDTEETLEFGDNNTTYTHDANRTIQSATLKSGLTEESYDNTEACTTEEELIAL